MLTRSPQQLSSAETMTKFINDLELSHCRRHGQLSRSCIPEIVM